MTDSKIQAVGLRTFRYGRLAWPLVAVVLVAVMLAKLVIFTWVLGVLLSVLTLYLLFWECPACGKSFSVRAGLFSLAWPWTNHCFHCNAALKKTSTSDPDVSLR
jgi:hypothetical protein